MTYRKQLAITTALLALTPFAAQAATFTWTGLSTAVWETAGNWTGGVPTGNSNTVTITSGSNGNPIHITANETYNTGATGSTTIGSGFAVNIDSPNTLTTRSITLSGGSLTGAGTFKISGTGATGITGFGTVSVPFGTAVNLTANGTPGNSLTLSGGNTITGGTLTTASGQGGFNLNGDKFNGAGFSGSGGTVNLNGATLNGATLNGSGEQFNVTGDSTLSGTIAFNQVANFSTGAHTLNLSAATLNTVSGTVGSITGPFTIGAGGTLNNASGTSTMGGGGTVTLSGGSIIGTAGLLKIGDPISGYGTISGAVDIAGSLTAAGSGKTLTVDGGSGSLQLGNSSGSGTSMSTSGGATLDLKGNLSLIDPATANPGTGTIQFDGANFTNASPFNPVSINNSGLTTAGTFDVVNASTLNNVAFSAGNGANLKIDVPLTVTGADPLTLRPRRSAAPEP
jgi:fibronectin-binding autotransporter adhesin